MSTSVNLILEGDDAWPDLRAKVAAGEVIHIANGGHIEIAALKGGMTSGKTALALRVDLPSGETLIFEMSLAMFLTCAQGLRARFGDEDGV